MKRKIILLSKRYRAGLNAYLKERQWGNLRPAYRLGQRAVTIGLQTLNLARIHEEAVGALRISRWSRLLNRQAACFFSEAIVPIEKLHEAALLADRNVTRLSDALLQRSGHLVRSRQRLKKGMIDRKAAQQALKTSGDHSAQLLKRSSRMQENLRYLARRILDAQENKRRKLSRDLQDEIAQMLLGLNVRLLALREQATLDAEGIRREIEAAQSVVDKSAEGIKRFARKLSKHHEAK